MDVKMDYILSIKSGRHRLLKETKETKETKNFSMTYENIVEMLVIENGQDYANELLTEFRTMLVDNPQSSVDAALDHMLVNNRLAHMLVIEEGHEKAIPMLRVLIQSK